MPELAKRILSALVAAPVFLYLIWLGGGFFIVTLLILTFIIQMEIIRMLHKQGLDVPIPFVLLLGVPVLFFGTAPEFAWFFFLLFLLMLMVAETLGSAADTWKRLMATIMVAVLVPALFSGLILIRDIGDNMTGFALTVTLLLMVWANDVFAYFGGKTMGRHQLAPKISPSKTIEGFIWGFAGCFVALILCILFLPGFPLSWLAAIPFAIIVGLFGPAGDLAESKLKRASGIKDSSGLMPGHGGLYDRFDAVLFAAPATAIYFQLLIYFSIL